MPARNIIVKKIFSGEEVKIPYKKGSDLIFSIHERVGFNYIEINDVVFENITPDFMARFTDVIFKNCSFINCDFRNVYFIRCQMIGCKFKGDNLEWLESKGLEVDNLKRKPILTPTNEQIERDYHCKVIALPNKSFVKVKWTCDFCHKEWYAIYRRDRMAYELYEVPNCGKHVCANCNSTYRLRDKFLGSRSYGYHGEVHKYRTPIDAENTAIIGLEMEFEGDFYGWKELQDAHQGMLHYGYDSSVVGQNELSWDCGSYSWWKYLAPLKNVCEVLGKYGGRAGDSAGIHIHVSRSDVNMSTITYKINKFGKEGVGRALFESVSLRNNKERFDMYSNLGCDMETHHAGISYNTYNTCEFRLFNSTLDYRLILRHIKFCKEIFNAFADGKDVWKSLSKETKSYILECATIQKDKGFITEEQFNLITEKL